MRPPPGHEGAKPLHELLRAHPDLATVVKALQPKYVFVDRYLRTIPKETDGITLRTDAYVNGLYVIDVRAVAARRYPQIDQDYLVQWRDDRTPQVAYYSGIPKRFRTTRPHLWHPIASFCPEFGYHGQYRCPDLDHSYRDLSDPRLNQEPEWKAAYARAMSQAQKLAAGLGSAP